MKQAKKFILPFIIFLLLYIAADNVYYELNIYNPKEKKFIFSAKHSTNINLTHSPSNYYRSITDNDLWVKPVKYRTGELGETLPHGGQGNCKIIFLGGSTTETHWVPENLRWPYLVGESEGIKNLATTYNFGVGGQNLHQSLQRYLTYIAEIEPEIVVVNHFANDLAKFMRGNYYTIEGSLHNSYGTERQDSYRARIRNIISKTLPFTYSTLIKLSNDGTLNLERNNNQIINQKQTNPIVGNFEYLAKNYQTRILALKSLVEGHGGKLVLIMQPNRYQALLSETQLNNNARTHLKLLLNKNGFNTDNFLTIDSQFKVFLKQLSTQYKLDLIDTSSFSDDTSHFYDALHLNTLGSQELAILVSNQLKPILKNQCPSLKRN